MAYRITQQANVFINKGKTLATWFTYQQGRYPNIKIRYVVRAGKKGTGRTLATASCLWGWAHQRNARQKIEKKIGFVEFMDLSNDESQAKFEAAGYIPDPYEK